MNLFSISSSLAISAVGISAALANLASARSSQRLADGWGYHQGSPGSTWESWRGEAATDNVTWRTVTLPHGFNGRDAVDPDTRYYRGPGWYRKPIQMVNPFPDARTLLHFGGYDEWSVDITDPSGKVIHTASQNPAPWSGDKEINAFEIAKPELWAPQTPALYLCGVTLKSKHGEHRVTARFGVRSVEWVKNGPFKLNGDRLPLRGTHCHEDHSGTASAVPDDGVRATFQSMKDLGAVFVRRGHHQQAPPVLDLRDQLGMLVWRGIPWCRGGLGGVRFRNQARDMLRNLIDQHYNHPSVVFRGLDNENDWPGAFEKFDKPAIRDFMTQPVTLSHELGPSRKSSIRRCDFCKYVIDVCSPGIRAGWYSGRYGDYRKSTGRAIQDTPHFFHAEYGGDSHAGRHAAYPEKFLADVATGKGTAEVGKAYKANGGPKRPSKDGDRSESDMISLFDLHLKKMEQMPNLTGAAQWIFNDFSIPLRPEIPGPYLNQKGVIARDGTPKESDYGYQGSEWGKPVRFGFEERNWTRSVSTLEARVFDQAGVPYLDAVNIVRFDLTGDGQLLDNLGTADGSRVFQLGNGRARISININGPSIVASVASEGIETKIPTPIS